MPGIAFKIGSIQIIGVRGCEKSAIYYTPFDIDKSIKFLKPRARHMIWWQSYSKCSHSRIHNANHRMLRLVRYTLAEKCTFKSRRVLLTSFPEATISKDSPNAISPIISKEKKLNHLQALMAFPAFAFNWDMS
jgi:hypothetical protein